MLPEVFFLVAFKEPLTKEEEEKYIKLFMSGNEEAKQILIEHNLRLVAHIIKKYSGCDKDINDMISIGTIGLIKAINTFNPNSGNKLVTYASRCIDNEILMFFRNEKKKNREVSLYEPIGTDKEGNVISIVDIVTLEDEDIVEKDDLYNKIKALREGLTTVLNEREKVIIQKRYGIIDGVETTQRELAKDMNISRSYVSRIEKRALQKLRKHIESVVDL